MTLKYAKWNFARSVGNHGPKLVSKVLTKDLKLIEKLCVKPAR